MKKILFIISFLVTSLFAVSQNNIVDADKVIARDEILLNGEKFSLLTPIDGQVIQRVGGEWVNSTLLLSMPFDYVTFATDQTEQAYEEGKMYFDYGRNNWVFFDSNSEVSLDVGKEVWEDVYNNTGATITNGSVVVLSGNGGLFPSIELAQADLPTHINNKMGIATHDIEHGTYGRMTVFGVTRGINTSSYVTGQKLYLSATTAGAFTGTNQSFPYYSILVGTVGTVHATEGTIVVSVIGDPSKITGNSHNGSFNETFDFEVTSNGTVITGTLTNRAGGDYLTAKWSNGFELYDVSSTMTVTLTVGTDANPQHQYVYINKLTDVLEVNTSYWLSTEHIPIAELFLQSAATTQTHSALRNQNTNNHLSSDDGMGDLDHIRKRIRILDSKYESGIASTMVGSGTATIYPTFTSGEAWQMHKQTFGAYDVSTDYGLVTNVYTTGYQWIQNLATITLDASGGTLNNNSYSIVTWAVQNSGTEPSHVLFNLPTDTYNSSANAIADLEGYSVYTIPHDYRGVGFLLYRYTFTNAGGVWTLNDTEDLRGLNPSTAAGGGGTGGTGVTELTQLDDTPSSYVGSGGSLLNVSLAENAVEFSGVTVDASDNLTANTLISDVAIGTSPLTVTSTTLVSLLNVDFLDGQHGSYYLDYDNFINAPDLTAYVQTVNSETPTAGNVDIDLQSVTDVGATTDNDLTINNASPEFMLLDNTIGNHNTNFKFTDVNDQLSISIFTTSPFYPLYLYPTGILPSDIIDDNGDVGADGDFLGKTGSALDWQSVSGGTTDHSALSNLDYASASHTGFQSTLPLTTEGDLLYRDATGLARLPVGTTGQVLSNNGTTVGWQTLSGSGTVTSVAAGNGMNFTTITGSGNVTLGTPSSITQTSTNSVTTTSHTHALEPILIQEVDNGAKTTNFDHDASSASIGAYTLSGSATISILNLSSGMMGTIFLDVTATATISVNTYSDDGSSGLTEVIIGDDIANASGKVTTITYTCADNGTASPIHVYLSYGQEQ